MIKIAIKEIQQIFKDHQVDLDQQAIVLKVKLEDFKKTLALADDISYVDAILNLGSDIIKADPKQLATYQKLFDMAIDPKLMMSKHKKKFRLNLIEVMGYTHLRSVFYPSYFHKVGIKSCVYCNALLTVCVERTGRASKLIVQGKFQVDHYISKKEYPCFSISLFNLYPVCANCNNAKGVKNVGFQLYVADDEQPYTSDFKFSLAKGCKAKYLLTRKIEDLKIIFDEPKAAGGMLELDKLFAITSIYETQKDLVAELILKAEVYTDAYKKSLRKALPKLFRDETIVNRLLLGNFAETQHVHQRPMAKFIQDIAIDVGLLKDQ